jgi:hypothetical protein
LEGWGRWRRILSPCRRLCGPPLTLDLGWGRLWLPRAPPTPTGRLPFLASEVFGRRRPSPSTLRRSQLPLRWPRQVRPCGGLASTAGCLCLNLDVSGRRRPSPSTLGRPPLPRRRPWWPWSVLPGSGQVMAALRAGGGAAGFFFPPPPLLRSPTPSLFSNSSRRWLPILCARWPAVIHVVSTSARLQPFHRPSHYPRFEDRLQRVV